MKRIIPHVLLFCLLSAIAEVTKAQSALAEDQNPNFAVSRDRYMKLADSVNAWHSTTVQDTYKAIDYMEDKREERMERKAFRREMRLARVRNGWYNNEYNSPYYHSSLHSPYNSFYRVRPYYYRNNANHLLWGAVPLAFALGLWWR